ncbi:MAG: hypothetical protein DRN16_03860, partial [Thermoplasmata archaeon]
KKPSVKKLYHACYQHNFTNIPGGLAIGVGFALLHEIGVNDSNRNCSLRCARKHRYSCPIIWRDQK